MECVGHGIVRVKAELSEVCENPVDLQFSKTSTLVRLGSSCIMLSTYSLYVLSIIQLLPKQTRVLVLENCGSMGLSRTSLSSISTPTIPATHTSRA
jgi:hypothetical protein